MERVEQGTGWAVDSDLLFVSSIVMVVAQLTVEEKIPNFARSKLEVHGALQPTTVRRVHRRHNSLKRTANVKSSSNKLSV
jgi:hypothetical protein